MSAEYFNGREVVHRTVVAIAAFAALAVMNSAYGADVWGGSAALTSDYFVRGISRTSDNAALQFDWHYANAAGFLAGVFASNTQINPSESRDLELSAFVGFAWNLSEDFRSKLLLSHYAYPWDQAGSNYNYDEIDADLTYQGWIHLNLNYSPNSPRFLLGPYRSFFGVTEKAAEVSLQRQFLGKLSATAGAGYSYLSGPDAGGYVYWSLGAAYDLRAVSFAVSYVNTTAGAKALFYNAAATGRWTATAIWRF